MKIAYMFSGQGSQYLGMGKDLYENYESVRKIFSKASKILGYDIANIMFDNEKKLNDTLYTQTSMFVLYQAILKVLEENHITSEYSLGLSLGEYGAYLHNNVFDFETGLEIVKNRGQFMQQSAENKPGLMCAIIGMNSEILLNLIDQINGYVKIANYNTYGQLVISGETKAVEELSQLALDNGARRAIFLKTSGAFHSDLMEEAKFKFSKYLNDIELNEPNKKLLVNITGDFYQTNIKEVMTEQITNSIKFYQMVEKLINEDVDTFIEIGPKTTLCSFVKKINRNLNILNVDSINSLKTTLSKLEE